MDNSLKKSLVIISILFFLISATGSTFATNINYNNILIEESQQKTVIIYRVAPNGNLTPIEVNINEETKDIGKYLESKCSELFEKDIEMQTIIQKIKYNINKDSYLLNTYNYSIENGYIGLIHVESHGRGFHFKTKINFDLRSILKLNNQFLLPRVLLENFLPSKRKSLVLGFYNDEKANTTFYPILLSEFNPDLVKHIEGNHTIVVISFFGYTTWTGRFSCLLSEILLKKDLLPRAFSGIGYLVKCYTK